MKLEMKLEIDQKFDSFYHYGVKVIITIYHNMPIAEHTLDLDKSPEIRWGFLAQYRNQVKDVEKYIMDDFLGTQNSIVLNLAEKIATKLTKVVAPQMAAYYADLRAISEILQIDLGRLILMQLISIILKPMSSIVESLTFLRCLISSYILTS